MIGVDYVETVEFDKCFYLGDYNKKFDELAKLSPEEWSFNNKSDNGILKNYIKYTFLKLQEESKVIKTDEYMVFNTGLFTEYYECIYGYAAKNIAGGEQPWFLKGFCTEYELANNNIIELPDRANYFSDPSLLVFDAKCKINVQYKHIFEDKANLDRIPEKIKNNPTLVNNFNGEIERMKKKVIANYKIAVPQYYNGNIQLLLPLCLDGTDTPTVALVVTKQNEHVYQGHTCLTLDMAYNNARLIAKPDSNWLKPI